MVAKDIVYTLASNQSMSNSNRGVAKTLVVDRQNIKAMGRWVQLDIIQNVLWINQGQASCLDALPQELRNVVIDWWIKETTISPKYKRCYEETNCCQAL